MSWLLISGLQRSLGSLITFKRLPQEAIVFSKTTAKFSQIHIPNRIERGSTDILEALEKTISKDNTAAHYKFHDDPYLTPLTHADSRSFALSKEAGRKAAAWIRQEHADLFQQKIADPEILAFSPSTIALEKDIVSEDMLKNAIMNRNLSNAISIYHLLECNISVATKQSLLELLCFYNSKGQTNSEYFLEETWYKAPTKDSRNTWEYTADITALFESLSENAETAGAAYSTLIAGTAKYCNVNEVWLLHQRAVEKNIPLNVNAYNSLISTLPLVRDKKNLREEVEHLFKQMVDNGISPNVGTLNAAAIVATSMEPQHNAKNYISSLLAEFNNLNIAPTLATYCYVLIVHYYKGSNEWKSPAVLEEILNRVEKKELTIQNIKDVAFFPTVMEIAAQRLQDSTLATRVHNLLVTNDNYKFISGNYMESVYYKTYITQRLRTDSLEEFMQFYDTLVPNTYIPEPSIIDKIIDTLRLNPADLARNYITHIWSHIVIFDFMDKNFIIESIFNLMYKHCKPPSVQSELHSQYADAAWTKWTRILAKEDRSMKSGTYSSAMLGYMTVLLSRANRIDEMLQVVSFMSKQEALVLGVMSNEHITELLDACVLNGDSLAAIEILQYAANIYDKHIVSRAKKICKELPLTATQKSKVATIVGIDIGELEKHET